MNDRVDSLPHYTLMAEELFAAKPAMSSTLWASADRTIMDRHGRSSDDHQRVTRLDTMVTMPSVEEVE